MIKLRLEAFLMSLLSRKFLLAVAGSTFTALNFIMGWGLTTEQIAAILVPLGGYVLLEGTADVVSRAKTTTVSTQGANVFTDDEDDDNRDGSSGIWTGTTASKSFDENTDNDEA